MKGLDPRVKKWLDTLSPAQRKEARALLRRSASRANREQAAQARKGLARAKREGCSGPRIKAFEFSGVPYRDPGMVQARGKVKYGDADRGTRRYTPPASVASEDRYDLMSEERAIWCADAPSITGRQLEYLRQRHLRVERPKLRTEKKKKEHAGDESDASRKSSRRH